MKIIVYNIKGGQGKTDIALNIALTLDYGFITNEPLSPVEMVLEEGNYLKLEQGESIQKIPDDYNIVFDFGGYLDKRAVHALKLSDYVIVPVVNEFKDIHTTVNFIQDIEEYNNKIIIVANKTLKGDYEEVKEIMGEHYPNYPVLEIKKSRAMPNILKDKSSIQGMVNQGGLKKFNYSSINEQFNKLIKVFQNG